MEGATLEEGILHSHRAGVIWRMDPVPQSICGIAGARYVSIVSIVNLKISIKAALKLCID